MSCILWGKLAAMRQPGVYPTDVSDDEWAFVAPCLTLMKEDAPQRVHSLRSGFNGSALRGPGRLSLAALAQRLAALADRAPTGHALAGSRDVCRQGP